MRGPRKQGTELEQLEKGLGAAEDPYMIKDLAGIAIDELAEKARSEFRYSAISMIRAGRYLMAIKARLGHGEWEEYVHGQGWSWSYVRASMKMLEVAAKFPQTLHLPAGRTTQQIYHLPMRDIDAIFTELPAETIKKLSPWEIEAIYQKQKDSRPPAKKKAAKPLPELPPPDERTDLLVAKVIAAMDALTELAKVDVAGLYDFIFERNFVPALGRAFDEVVEHLNPLEEITKRATAVHAPGYEQGDDD